MSIKAIALDRSVSQVYGTDTAGHVSQTNLVPEDLICTDDEIRFLVNAFPGSKSAVYEQAGITWDWSKDANQRKPWMIYFADGTSTQAKRMLILMGAPDTYGSFVGKDNSWKWVADEVLPSLVTTSDPGALQKKMDEVANNAKSYQEEVLGLLNRIATKVGA